MIKNVYKHQIFDFLNIQKKSEKDVKFYKFEKKSYLMNDFFIIIVCYQFYSSFSVYKDSQIFIKNLFFQIDINININS